MENNITKRAVIYARYSSDKQTEQSIEGQVKVCREFADKMKISIIGEYIDRAMTGTNDNRPEFQRMLADSKNGLFNMILVYKLDRFSRDKYESVVHKRNLKNNGVKVQSATEMISDSPEGILLESVIEGYNQFYSAELSQKIKRGNRMNIEKGLWTGGNLTYGYKVIDKKVHIDEPKAEIVRKIFTDYANGKTKQEICRELNATGIKTGAGLIWRVNSLQTVFMTNKKYIGIVEKHGEIFNNIYPRIIDNITFERVQNMLAKKKKLSAKGKAKVEYELTGKAFCLHCGTTIYGVSGKSGKFCYYACKNRYSALYRNCKKANEHKTELETAVIQDAIDFMSKQENIDRASKKLADFHAKNITTQKVKDLEKRLTEIDREIEKLLDLALTASGATMLAKINQRSNDLEIQKTDLQNELANMRFLQAVPKTADDYKKRLKEFIHGDIHDLQYRKKIIHGLINSVWVADGGIFVFYNTDNEKPLTLDEVKQSLNDNGIDYNALVSCGSNMKCCGGSSRT